MVENFPMKDFKMSSNLNKIEENVNHPAHYKKGGIEVIDFIMGWFEKDYLLGNVCKYISRSKFKGKELEDLKKALWYLNKKISILEKINLEEDKEKII